MKKHLFGLINIILSIIFIPMVCLTGCSTKTTAKDELIDTISLIVSDTYGSITPIDIYEIKGGSILFDESDKNIELEKAYSFYAVSSSKTKLNQTSSTQYVIGLKVPSNYKIGIWDIKRARPAIGYPVSLEYRRLYSQYYGEVEFVSAKTDLLFRETLHIELEEKTDTYKITYYYDRNNFEDYVCFNDYKKINDNKKIVEVLKDDILKIEYFT